MNHDPVKKPTLSKKVTTSKTLLFAVACVIALAAFGLGTRERELLAIVGPAFGIKVDTSSLDLSSVEATYHTLKEKYDGTLDNAKLIDGANKGMVEAVGDDYTVYFNAKAADEFNKDLSGDIGGGIGAEIGLRAGQPTIVRVLEDNPAQQAGLQKDDVIISVNDESMVKQTVEKAVGAIRGEDGTTVKIGIKRNGKTKNFTVTRAIVNNPSVQAEVKNGVGIMTISRFDAETGSLARKAAESFKSKNVKAVIVDLRSDGGGYLDAAADVASIWLNDKQVVTQRHDGTVIDERRSGSDPVFDNGIKTIVLVNEGSASASEILAASLRDNGAAKLLGVKTFGKGSVQEVVDLHDNGALLKVTVARWYTPAGKNVNKNGLDPDTEVKITLADINQGKDPQLTAALKVLQ